MTKAKRFFDTTFLTFTFTELYSKIRLQSVHSQSTQTVMNLLLFDVFHLLKMAISMAQPNNKEVLCEEHSRMIQ